MCQCVFVCEVTCVIVAADSIGSACRPIKSLMHKQNELCKWKAVRKGQSYFFLFQSEELWTSSAEKITVMQI